MQRSRILIVFLFICALVFGLGYQDKAISFLPLYAMLLLILFSFIAMLAAPALIRVEQWAERYNIFKNENLVYSSRITNRGVFHYPQLKIIHFSPEYMLRQEGEEEAVAASPRSTVEQRHAARFPYRGIYQLGIRSITVVDFLGLFRYTFPVGRTMTVAVYPKVDPHFTLPVKTGRHDVTQFQYNYYSDNYGDVTDLRKYVPSDDYKKIHWKLTAKRSELIVKDFQSAVQNKTQMLLDTKAIPLPAQEALAFEDRMVSYVASSVYFCALNQLPVELVYGHSLAQRATINPSEDPNRIFHLLAEIPFQEEDSILPAFYRAIDRNAPATDMALFLSCLDEELAEYIRGLGGAGHNLILFYFPLQLPVSTEMEERLERIRVAGVQVHKVTEREEAQAQP